MAGLFGYIATVLGASVFNIAEGIPLLPLQTLWLSFTMLSIQSVGLVYSRPAAGLMDRPPAAQAHGLAVARTMGMVTFALFTLFSIE